jgi:hypothetical protein
MRPVLRALLWLAILVLLLACAWSGNADLGAAGAVLALLAFAILAPPLRPAIVVLLPGALLVRVFGDAALLIDLLPPVIAGVVGWLFARTLLDGRRPLIARAIAAIDGEDWLTQPAVRRYALRLTALWAGVQGLLMLLGAACVLHARGAWPLLSLPAPHLFAAFILPGVVVLTFLTEFALRPALLPQAPKHGLVFFVRRLVRAWPQLLD